MVGQSEFKPGAVRQKTRQEEEIDYLRQQLQVKHGQVYQISKDMGFVPNDNSDQSGQ